MFINLINNLAFGSVIKTKKIHYDRKFQYNFNIYDKSNSTERERLYDCLK